MQRYFRNHREADLDCSSRIVRKELRFLEVRNPHKAFRHELARRAGNVGSRRGIRVLCVYSTGRIARRIFRFPPSGLEASFSHEVIARANGQLIIQVSPFNFVLRFR